MAMQIRKINSDTRQVAHVVALTALNTSRSQAIDVSGNGTLYLADYANDVILKVFENGILNGAILGHIGASGNVNADGITVTGNSARMTNPGSICVGQKGGHAFFGDGNGTGWQIRRMSSSGTCSYFAGNYAFAGDVVNNTVGDNDGTLSRFSPANNGMGMCVDRAGRVYIADTGNNKIKKIWESGHTTSLAGGGTAGMANATGNAAWFNSPKDCCVDNQGNVYVADSANHRIRRVTESGVVSTLSGTSFNGYQDGNATNAYWGSPERICIDPSNQFLYVLDRTNNAVRKVDMNGNVSTICPYLPSASGLGDICVDNSGFLYILENAS